MASVYTVAEIRQGTTGSWIDVTDRLFDTVVINEGRDISRVGGPSARSKTSSLSCKLLNNDGYFSKGAAAWFGAGSQFRYQWRKSPTDTLETRFIGRLSELRITQMSDGGPTMAECRFLGPTWLVNSGEIPEQYFVGKTLREMFHVVGESAGLGNHEFYTPADATTYTIRTRPGHQGLQDIASLAGGWYYDTPQGQIRLETAQDRLDAPVSEFYSDHSTGSNYSPRIELKTQFTHLSIGGQNVYGYEITLPSETIGPRKFDYLLYTIADTSHKVRYATGANSWAESSPAHYGGHNSHMYRWNPPADAIDQTFIGIIVPNQPVAINRVTQASWHLNKQLIPYPERVTRTFGVVNRLDGELQVWHSGSSGEPVEYTADVTNTVSSHGLDDNIAGNPATIVKSLRIQGSYTVDSPLNVDSVSVELTAESSAESQANSGTFYKYFDNLTWHGPTDGSDGWWHSGYAAWRKKIASKWSGTTLNTYQDVAINTMTYRGPLPASGLKSENEKWDYNVAPDGYTQVRFGEPEYSLSGNTINFWVDLDIKFPRPVLNTDASDLVGFAQGGGSDGWVNPNLPTTYPEPHVVMYGENNHAYGTVTATFKLTYSLGGAAGFAVYKTSYQDDDSIAKYGYRPTDYPVIGVVTLSTAIPDDYEPDFTDLLARMKAIADRYSEPVPVYRVRMLNSPDWADDIFNRRISDKINLTLTRDFIENESLAHVESITTEIHPTGNVVQTIYLTKSTENYFSDD